MTWLRLERFRDPAIPKLHNLRRAERAGLRVPPTVWAPAAELEEVRSHTRPPGDAFRGALMVRSGSPTEDTAMTSNAGQFVSLAVEPSGDFGAALREVIGSLPKQDGRRQGVVFVQPVVAGGFAGVTFFDGFYYEETSAPCGNADLTSGRDRGEVRRGHVQRGDPHSEWLNRVHRVFGGRLDLEWVEPTPGERVLLQARPALFPIRRNETVSLANHKEILGDPPSPWMVGVLVEVSRPVMRHFGMVEPAVASWDEPYAIELGERAWMNFSAFFRLMDHWGLPRTMVTEGVGGEAAGPADAGYIPRRFWRKVPTMTCMGLANFATVARVGRELAALDRALAEARTLLDLQRVNVRALDLSIRTNFAIMQNLSVFVRFRRRLGLTQAARVVTHVMMERFAELSARPTLEERLAGLDAWLEEFGHRGPLESDPWHPRFSELREQLRRDLERGPAPRPEPRPQPSALSAALCRPFFLPDEWRESFRDRLMKWWGRLRLRILEEARRAVADGHLDRVEDVFFLRSEDLGADPTTWRARVATRRRRWERARKVAMPTTATRDEVGRAVSIVELPDDSPAEDRWAGIGIGSMPVTGTAVVASDVCSLLNRTSLPESPILIASALEPSWSVVFPRFAAVVADLGGELSHAAILLREAGIPAIVNARGIFAAIRDGEKIHVDPVQGEVVRDPNYTKPPCVPVSEIAPALPTSVLFNKTG